MLSIRRILAILRKEFVQLRRDITTMRMIVTIPIIQLLLFGFAINSDPKHLPTALIVHDYSEVTNNILTGLKNSSYFSVVYSNVSANKAHQLLQKGDVTFVITIPRGFLKSLIRRQKPHLLIEADATDPLAVSGALSYMDGIVSRSIQKLNLGVLNIQNNFELPYEIRAHKLYNPEGLTRFNIVPGLIAVVLTMTCVMMTALSLTKERERGTMENLLSMPGRPIEVMAGKIAPYVLIGYVQAGIILLAARFVFGVPIFGGIWLLAIALLLFIVCNLALGFSLSTVSENQMQAMQGSIFVLLPSILLSGFMFPFHGMPLWAQYIGSILPSTYFIRIVRGVMLKGNSIYEVLPHMWPLVVFMVVVVFITIRAYKDTLD